MASKRAGKNQAGRLAGKVAVVTGASRGIGLAIAQALAAEGCALAVSSRNPKSLAAASKRIHGGRLLTLACDVRAAGSVDAFFAAVRREFGRVDIMVNNAGIAHTMKPVEELSVDAWQDVIATNLTGTFLCTRAALPLMRAGGVIVNNLSIAAGTVFAGLSAYDASKHGALGFTNTLREELRGRGIRVLALITGATDTDIWQQFMPEADRKTMMRPAAIAAMVVEAIALPPDAPVEEIRMMPPRGTNRN
ncbi:MAG TPA: SDR family NAD(P)-dependent oxidoreductase [Terriglobales bacterium]|nr:SDR family NAD(P)-dependent oxidoreductase [Terriglobales bacterium]